MKIIPSSSTTGLTLIETLVTTVCMSIVLAIVMVAMSTGTVLMAKNISTNASHNTMRSALDRIGLAMDSATGEPVLVNVTGGVVPGGSAAGIRFDQHLGGPYVVSHPGGSGLSASAMSASITRSLHELASPPVPQEGDVLLFDGSPNIRLRVSNVAIGATDASNRQEMTVNFANAAGTAINWDPGTVKTARVVRAVAFVVVPAGARNQLRIYNNAETVTNYSTASGYAIICDNVGSNAGDITPFSLSTNKDFNNRKFLDVALRIRVRDYDKRLASKESNNFSSTMRLEVTLTPKGT